MYLHMRLMALVIVVSLMIVMALVVVLALMVVMALPIVTGLALKTLRLAIVTLRAVIALLAIVTLVLFVGLLALAVHHLGIARRLLMLRTRLTLEALALSVHHPEIVLGMLKEILGGDTIAGGLRLARQRQITLKNLIGIAANFDVGTVAVEGLRPVLRARPTTTTVRIVVIGIAAAVAAARSLLWSHVTCLVAVEPIGSLSGRMLGTHPLVLRSDPLCGAFRPRDAINVSPAGCAPS